MFAEKFGVETDIAGFVDAVNVSECSGDGKVGTDFCEIAIYIPDIFRLSVQRCIVDTSIINTYI
jgi:hypothetical protein